MFEKKKVVWNDCGKLKGETGLWYQKASHSLLEVKAPYNFPDMLKPFLVDMIKQKF